MADFLMPSLGADMEAGTLVEWKVKVGDAIKRGDIIAMVETEKGLIDLEIWESGVIEEIIVFPGTRVPVGAVLARVRGEKGAAAPAPPPPVAPAPPSPVERAPVVPEAGRAVSVRASPVARKLAKDQGVDLSQVSGTGPGGAVTREDVEAYRKARSPAPAPPSAPPAAMPPEERATAMRRAIAAAMTRSKREIPHYYLGTHIDMGRAMACLHERNQGRSVTERLLPVALLLKAVGLAVRSVPELNGFFQDGFRPSEQVHVGCAISLRQGGLVAPALHDVDRKGLEELMREFNDLVSRARSGHLRSSELADGTITMTSLGDRGAESVFGVIFPPQVALVGFGRIVEEPAGIAGRVELRPRLFASLSADHRASDGHRGGLFLEKLDRLLQAPENL